MSTAQSSVVFGPHNYLLSDPSRQTVQLQVELDLTGDKVIVDADYSDFQIDYTVNKMHKGW
ncbi:hypothetical protein BJ165DRAFT_1533720 [Panaeolus papilionaceus]|nr:hypothetical protein BJ165DRAFT_1533720 [Panaeolus papilionaceus]